MEKIYKIALIDQRGNAGGGVRFVKQLISNFSYYNKNIKIDYYGNSKIIKKNNFSFFINFFKYVIYRNLKVFLF